MNRSNPIKLSLLLRPEKTFSKDSGNVFSSMGLRSRPRAAFQKGLRTNPFCHHSRQRSTVLRLTPTSSYSCAILFGEAPWRMAEIRTTTEDKNTLRPKKRKEDGV